MEMMPVYLNNSKTGTLSSLGIREGLHNVLHREKKQRSGTWQTWGSSQVCYLILDKITELLQAHFFIH